MSAEKIYAAMRNSGMTDWVGGGDPAGVGGSNFSSIIENLPLQRHDAVLDFGCGIGRTSVLLAEFLNEGGSLVGSDIVPGHIEFCREQFAHPFPNATFYCMKASNPSYNHLITQTENATPAIDEEIFFQQYRDVFDMTIAFSVFTHFDQTMAAHYLRSLRDVTKPSGHILLIGSSIILATQRNFLGYPRLGAGENFTDPKGDLSFVLFSPAAVAELASSAGLLV